VRLHVRFGPLIKTHNFGIRTARFPATINQFSQRTAWLSSREADLNEVAGATADLSSGGCLKV
jgi:hypothetical protein